MSSTLGSNLVQNSITPGRQADAFASLTVPSRQASVQASRPSSVTTSPSVSRRRSKAPDPPRRTASPSRCQSVASGRQPTPLTPLTLRPPGAVPSPQTPPPPPRLPPPVPKRRLPPPRPPPPPPSSPPPGPAHATQHTPAPPPP